MKIALLGGSFNPPHLGHRALVNQLLQSNMFDEIWIIPTLHHAFGKELASFEERVKMCSINFEELSPQIKIQLFEKEINNLEGYSINLIRFLKKNFNSEEFYWVMGSDLMAEKNKWKNFEEIESKVNIYPIARSGYEESELPQISSTEIREQINLKQPLPHLLLPQVQQYIQDQRLYL